MKILIADDSAFMRGIVKKILSENGIAEVIEAVDGQDAVNKYKEIHPDAVFLDIMMPNKTGIEALKEIIALNNAAKVIMCTSVGQEKIVQEAVEGGATDFVTKPFKPEDIKEALSKLN